MLTMMPYQSITVSSVCRVSLAVFNIFYPNQKINILAAALLNGMLFTSSKVMKYCKNNVYKMKTTISNT